MKANKLVVTQSSHITFPPGLLQQIVECNPSSSSQKFELISLFNQILDSHRAPCPLSHKERRMLCLLKEGLTNSQAMKAMGVSNSSYFLEMIYRKLNVQNKCGAIDTAIQEGWLDDYDDFPFEKLETSIKSLSQTEFLEMRYQGYSFRYAPKDGAMTKCVLMSLKKWSLLKDDWKRKNFNFLRGNNSADRWAHIDGTNYPVITIKSN